MKLLLLLPAFVLIAISGVNLYNELTLPVPAFAMMVLHLSVLAACLAFCGRLVKSMFAIKYTEVEENENKVVRQPKVIQLQQTA